MGAIKVVGRRALIGRGFLGSVLDVPGRWTDRYHSHNIYKMSGEYDLVVIAAPGAKKWDANHRPQVDQEQVNRLTAALGHVTTKRMVLLSTIDAKFQHAYGRHRWELELFCQAYFDVCILRLPALFGPGLRKNSLFDLLSGRSVPNGVYHWYNVEHLWEDVRRATPGIRALYSEHLSMWEIAERLGLTHLVTKEPGTVYDEVPPYTATSEQILEEICTYVQSQKMV